MKTVYLAGPITECDRGEANNWRDYAVKRLAQSGIRGISPLRCEPLVSERYQLGYEDPRFGTARAIASKNFHDVQACDLTLCYLPEELNSRKISLGTICELSWAWALRKPTILVSDFPTLVDHPVIQANASWIIGTLDEGLEIVEGILRDFVSTKELSSARLQQ